jgi:NADPH-dependent glutamate synthase beta chain and related oxidoreductases
MNRNLFEECEGCLQDEPAATTAWCPVHIDVPSMLSEIENGDFKKAYKILEKRIPFAGILGMICDHPCESVCVRGNLDQAVSISELERAAVAYGYAPFRKGTSGPKNKGKVAVVGGGISGITAAFELDKKGFQATIYEAAMRLGGRIWDFEGELIGKDAIDEELQIIEGLGIKVNYGCRIGAKELKELTDEYQAVFLGTGAWESGLFISTETLQVLDWPVFAGGRLYTRNDSVIHSVSSGKRAAISIERYIKKISLTASREREGSFETPMKYNLEGEPSAARIEKTSRIYTEEEAMREAKRCLKCRCVECEKACSHMRKFNITPKSYGRQIQINENVIMGTRYANTMINSCTMCGLCEEQCPLNIGMKDLIHETRESMVLKSKMPPSAHDFALKDMEFSNSSRFFLVKTAPPPSITIEEEGAGNGHEEAMRSDRTEYLFYPGCQLSASSPGYVEKTYRYLLSKIKEGVGLMLGCCGAPADWAGRNDLMAESMERFRRAWKDAGKPVFILACSSCISIFERYLPEIPIISLWEVFRKYGLPEGAGRIQGHVLSIHDACSTRHNQAVQESIRMIASDLGCKIEELNFAKEKAKCCGYGGLVYFANREQADVFAEDRVLESKNDLLVYCAMCKDLFVEKGKRTFHILDLIFSKNPEEDALRKIPNLSDRHANRASLKNKLLRELWGETSETDGIRQGALNLVIPQHIWDLMEKRFILFEDIEAVVLHSRTSGERFFNSDDSSFLAHLRIKYVTYWVRYAEMEDGIHVLGAYSHRMEIIS